MLKMAVPSFAFMAVYLFALMMLASEGVADPIISVESCRNAGFDPWQLSCSTCDLLPASVTAKCKSCCLSYKTLEKRTHRYEAAVLVHANIANYFPEIDSLLNEDLEGLLEKKGEQRLVVKKTSGGGNMYQPNPSIIFWFDEIPSADLDVYELESKSVESMVLDGWKRDDVRDMLLALLPDQ
jgi:hypothetical protein